MSNTKKQLLKDELNEVTGGESSTKEGIEEFDWKEIGNYTPLKHDPNDDSWEFSGEGNVEGQYFKRIKEGKK